jgi:hypothetical protein
MVNIRLCVRCLAWVFVLSCVLPRWCAAQTMLLDDTLRVKGTLYQFAMYNTTVPREDKRYYRDHNWGLMRTKGTLELLYKAFDNDRFDVNFFGFFQWWHEAVPDFDGAYGRSIADRKKFRGPYFDQDDWINELYADIYYGKWNFRLGKQIIFWSEVEMVRTIDRINPLDLRYTSPGIDPWDEMYLGLWMLRAVYYSELPGQLMFDAVWIPGDFEEVRTPTEGTALGAIPAPQGPRDQRPRPFGQSWAVQKGFNRDRPAFTLSNSTFAFRIRGNSEVPMFNDFYLLDWTLTWYRGFNTTPVARSRTLGDPTSFDSSTLNGYLNSNAVSRVFGLSLPDMPRHRLWSYKYFDAVGASCQTYIPSLQGVLRGEVSYEIGLPVNQGPRGMTKKTAGQAPITGSTERDQLNVGITLDRPFKWRWLADQHWAKTGGIFDVTLGWFGQRRMGNLNRVRNTFGYGDRTQSNIALTVRGKLFHNSLWPTFRALYNTRKWGYCVYSLRYTPGKHWRYEIGYLQFYANNPYDSPEASSRYKDSIYARIGYEF